MPSILWHVLEIKIKWKPNSFNFEKPSFFVSNAARSWDNDFMHETPGRQSSGTQNAEADSKKVFADWKAMGKKKIEEAVEVTPWCLYGWKHQTLLIVGHSFVNTQLSINRPQFFLFQELD